MTGAADSDLLSDDESEPAGLARPALWVNLFTLAQALAAVALGVGLRDHTELLTASRHSNVAITIALIALIGALFFAAESFVFHVEFRREAMTFSLAEVPLAFALVFLSPLAAIAARVIGSLAALAKDGWPSPSKLAFNTVNLALDTIVATLVLRMLVGPTPSSAGVAAALVPAIALASCLSGMSVVVVVSIFEGQLWSNIRTEALSAPASALVVASVSSLAAAPAVLDFRLAPLAAVPTIAFWFIARSNGAQLQHNRDLEDMHSFARKIGESLDPLEVAEAAALEISRLLRASKCRLVVLDPHSRSERGRAGDEELDVALPCSLDGWLAYAPSPGSAHRVGHGSLPAADLDALGLRQLVITPVRDDHDTLAFVAIADREGVAEWFEQSDLRRLNALADQLALALRRTLLHESLEWEATHDVLTGRPNRTLLERLTAASLNSASGDALGLLVVHLERVGEVNETLGHTAGDNLLRDVAEHVAGHLDTGDTLARIDGHRLAVLALRREHRDIVTLAARLAQALGRTFRVHEVDVTVDAAIGVACAPDDGEDPTTLLRHAEIALRECATQRNSFEFYRPEVDDATTERLALLGELRHAIDNEQLQLYYQPKLQLATNTIIGAEALVRWNHPIRGIVPPDQFIPLAERTGLIHDLTGAVIEQAMGDLEQWCIDGLDLVIAVNVSIQNLLDELLPDRLARLLERHHVEPGRVILEITESTVMTDSDRSLRTLHRLAALGVHLSIDDYGTGYSSLTYLRQLPVNELKIDRSFVSNVLLNRDDEMIVKSTIDLAHQLRLHVVAEGVEDTETADRLHQLGCDTAQGYGISRPLNRNAFTDFLCNHRTQAHSSPRDDERTR